MLKFLKRIIIVIILIILFAGTILTYKGYQIYKEALKKISVADKVAEIKQEENYAELKELPEFYLDAVIAVEDRRFYSHGAVDPIAKKLRTKKIRIEIDESNEKIGYKIRKAQLEKVPYMLVIGGKEQEAKLVAVRSRKDGDMGQMPVEEFIEKIQK